MTKGEIKQYRNQRSRQLTRKKKKFRQNEKEYYELFANLLNNKNEW